MSVLWSVPGKCFLLGEYSVLSHGRALVSCVGPRFFWDSNKPFRNAPRASPIQKLSQWAIDMGHKPLQGGIQQSLVASGHGSSTAEFLLALAQVAPTMTVWQAYDLYQSFYADDAVSPSGADVIAQFSGGTIFLDRFNKTIESLILTEFLSKLHIYRVHSSLKVKTHEHLERQARLITGSNWELFDTLCTKGFESLKASDWQSFCQTLNQYGDLLSERGLEHAHTTALKKEFRSMPQVLAVKGSGADQADLIIVAVKDDVSNTCVREKAERLGLKPLVIGLVEQKGLSTFVCGH